MFGYLNLGNPKLIGNTEAQEAVNCRVDRGLLEFATWPVSTHPARDVSLGSIIVNGRVYRSLPYPDDTGLIVWDYNSVVGDVLGIAKPSSVPTVAAVAHGSQPYPPGTYQWAMTLYNPITGEESIPAITGDILIGVNEVAKFSAIPSYASTYPKKTHLQWRLYRRPLGGGEYLLVPITIGAFSPWGDVEEDTADIDLGEACDSFDNGTISTTDSMAWFSGKLWNAEFKALQFSMTDKPWAFPTTFQFTFGDVITGLYPFGEAMIVTLQSQKPRIIYGDDETNFSIKEIDAEIGLAPNGGRIVSGALFLPQQSFQSVMVTPPEATWAIDGVTIFDGARPVNISNKIRALFPKFAYYPNSVDDTYEPQTGVVENRFYVLKINTTELPMATPADIETDHFSVVYDIHAKGFLTGDDVQTFRYRTKDFSVPPKARYLKRLFVESQGQVEVEVYLDGNLASTISFNNTTKTLNWFTTKPWRTDSFSLRFVGQPGAKVYSFGVVDPAIQVGG